MGDPPYAHDDEDRLGPAILATPDGTTTAAPPWTYYRSLPPAVQQEKGWMCWAAATESWLVVTPSHGDPATQQELAQRYGKAHNGALEPLSGLPPLAQFYVMDWDTLDAKKLKAQYLADKLRDFGHLLLIFNEVYSTGGPALAAHTHLVYGIGYPNGKDLMVSAMDPDGAKYVNHPLSFYKDMGRVIVVWPKPRGDFAP